MQARDILFLAMRAQKFAADLVEVHRRRVDYADALGTMFEKRPGHERAGEEAYGRTGDQIAPAQSNKIGSARPRADEVNGHGSFLPAIAQLARPSLMRATSRMEDGPAPASAAASAIDGSPNIAITLGEFVAARKEACRKTWPSRKTSGRPTAFAALARSASLFLASCVKSAAGATAQDAAAMARSTSAAIASLEQPFLQPMPIATAVLPASWERSSFLSPRMSIKGTDSMTWARHPAAAASTYLVVADPKPCVRRYPLAVI